ncbi:hypothetical protein KJ705_05010 [Patescibacteria group bacterium]|nr:hypothetical protein [Patescibacteria group bacterium]
MSEPKRKKRRIGFDRPAKEDKPPTTLELFRSMPVERLRVDRSFSGPMTLSIADIPDDEDHDDF